MSSKFLRQDYMRHLRLGKKARKLQKWRKPRGVHSKMRRKRFSYPLQPGIGYGTPRAEAGKVNGLMPMLVHNVTELSSLGRDSAVIIARVGARKKLDIIRKAEEMKLRILNVNKGGRR